MSLMSLPHHPKKRGANFFVDFLTRGMRKLILKKRVSKVNNFENRGIKIGGSKLHLSQKKYQSYADKI
jgi:galactose-1-phosphate uridylyltransferase